MRSDWKLIRWLPILGLMCATPGFAADNPTRFTRLEPIRNVRITASAEPYPSDAYRVENLIDGNPKTEYSSNAKGTETFVEFDFGSPLPIAAFHHVDRRDPATISASELVLLGEDGKPLSTIAVTHANTPAGETHFVLPKPVVAQRVRWRVTGLGPANHATVGGAQIEFLAAGKIDTSPSELSMTVTALPILERKGEQSVRPLQVAIAWPYAETLDATLTINGAEAKPVALRHGSQTVAAALPAAQDSKPLRFVLEAGGKTLSEQTLTPPPVRRFTIYILPHSHVDIGYTEIQPDVEKKQMANLAKGIELARATANYPEGARYKWNSEVLWAVDHYLTRSTPEKQQELVDAVKNGSVGLDGMYCNMLTGLCRPEELMRLFSYAERLSERCGVKIESAMISDVPGYTWGVVTAMAQAGVKYWSIGPNYMDRIGRTMVTWENKPFWWVGPSGRERVLCWVPTTGYALSHILRGLPESYFRDLAARLESGGYPYDIIQLRWSGFGDNAVPDEKLPDFVRDWNAKYESPRLVIATTAEAFAAFEKKYGDKLPSYSGDFTPYWEDGAGSSALETAMNRASAERLVQTETLYAMLKPTAFPAAGFHDAWRNVLLYSEHTWGAHNSITEPEAQFVKDQWKIKQAFALDADKQSAKLLTDALAARGGPAAPGHIDVYNTTSWPRTQLVTVPKELSAAGNRVTDSDGKPVPSQRLSSGELAFVAVNVPPFASRRYAVSAGDAAAGKAEAKGASLRNETLTVRVDEKTGAIVELRAQGIDANLADDKSVALNQYVFLPGDNPKDAQNNGPVKITVKEAGPLVASLLIESDAPGCNRLAREVRVTSGADYVEIVNLVDKKRAEAHGVKPGDWAAASRQAKEGVHFGFAFNVPDGVMRMDIPYAVMRPEADQIPGACKNWFTVQRWVDVSNDRYGVTWSSLDAPLVEVGGLTANLLGSQTKPDAWIGKLEPTQTLYSWAMNNHWHTNYRAYQEGPTTFRYALRPHRGCEPTDAARFGASLSQPLLVAAAAGPAVSIPRVTAEPSDILITAFKPSDDGKAFILRLFGASGRITRATLRWSGPAPATMWLSDLSEKPLQQIKGDIEVPAWAVITVRAERRP